MLAHRLEDRTAFGAHRLNVVLDVFFGFGVNHRADIGGQTFRITHTTLGHGAAQHGQGVIGNVVLQAQYA